MELNWLPIEDAPRDGTRVIVWPPTEHGAVSIASLFDDACADCPTPFWWRYDSASKVRDRMNPPTHYMPLLRGPNGEEA